MARYFTLNVLLLFLSLPYQVIAQIPVINLVEFSVGYASPVDIQNCGDSRLFIVQQTGYIYICDSAGTKNSIPFLDIHTQISFSSERGLLGMVFHPDYSNNGYFFIYYTSVDSERSPYHASPLTLLILVLLMLIAKWS